MILKIVVIAMFAVAVWRIAMSLLRLRRRPAGPGITSQSSEGIFDLVFAIRENERLPDGTRRLRLVGTHEGGRVGLIASLGADWKPFSIGDELPTAFSGFVTLHSVGAESDALLRAMDRLYGTGLQPKRMKAASSLAAVTLAGDPRDLFKGPVRIKLFFEDLPGESPRDEEEETNGELFLIIHAVADRAWLAEKDTAYRALVIRALTRQ